jgi:hypothetical protein
MGPEIRKPDQEPTVDHDVFLSYSWDNTSHVDGLKAALQDLKQDVRIFRDRENLHIGDEVDTRLDAAIRSSARFVPVYSEAYMLSDACLREFYTARNIARHRQLERFIRPVRVEKFSKAKPEI